MPVDLRLTYDASTDVAYLALRETGPADIYGPTLLVEHDRDFAGQVALDFTLADGRVVGFEFGMASACLPAELLLHAQRIDGRHLDVIVEKRLRPVLRQFGESGRLPRRSTGRRKH